MMTTRLQRQVRMLFDRLIAQPRVYFPENGGAKISRKVGVYIIYNPRGDVLHVGASVRGVNGLRQRLNNHLHSRSSFVRRYMNKQGAKLRRGYFLRCLPVKNHRHRALLEAYTIGYLCPAHIGLGQRRS